MTVLPFLAKRSFHFYLKGDFMSKTIEQLQQEYAANEVKIQQEKHKLQRLNNRVQYYEKGDRQKRAHRLITRGAAIESVAPEVKELSEAEFYTLAEYIFSLPEVKTAVSMAVTKHEKSQQKDGE